MLLNYFRAGWLLKKNKDFFRDAKKFASYSLHMWLYRHFWDKKSSRDLEQAQNIWPLRPRKGKYSPKRPYRLWSDKIRYALMSKSVMCALGRFSIAGCFDLQFERKHWMQREIIPSMVHFITWNTFILWCWGARMQIASANVLSNWGCESLATR